MYDKKSLRCNPRMFLTLCATVIASASTCVYADSPFAPVAVQVKYSDLNANTAEGAQRLYSRIETAAYAACGESRSDAPALMFAPGPCVRDAVGRAVHAAKLPKLAKVFIEKNGMDAAQQFGIMGDVRSAKN
jgi:UrcA family protein